MNPRFRRKGDVTYFVVMALGAIAWLTILACGCWLVALKNGWLS